MKIPANSALLMEAKAYALESAAHTFDYKGWTDKHAKLSRLTHGKWAQLWLGELCRLNGYEYEKDASSPYVHDNSDLLINGWAIDCKVSTRNGLEGQISPHYKKQNGQVQFYAFFRSDTRITFIEPLGFLHYSRVEACSDLVREGEIIPGTSYVQRFAQSYFVRQDELLRFYKHITWMAKNPRHEWEASQCM